MTYVNPCKNFDWRNVKEMSLERLEIFSIVKTMIELSLFIGNSNG